jgi:opacity protein-like surface antigen
MTFSLAALPLALLAVSAAEGDGAYLELGAGVTGTADLESLSGEAGFSTGYALNAAVGYRWAEAVGGLDFSLEGEGLFTRQSLSDRLLGPGSSEADYLSTGSLFANGVLSWPYSDEITFYAGGGVGIAASLTLEDKGDQASSFGVADDTALVYQGKVGVRFRLAENMAWYLQYRHVGSEDVTFEDVFLDQSFDSDIQQDLVEIGVRYGY